MIVIFTGPTLSSEDGKHRLPAVYLPPVSQGDVYRVAEQGADAIGIIDGYFDQVPAVWHKEILWAMKRGIPVYGASSMGALRAAELHQFGMIGVGKIFEAFRDGELEDDDEVAILHKSADDGYSQVSEPMVNIRATLDAAALANVISISTREVLTTIGKALFYVDRQYTTILQHALEMEPSLASELEALRSWLPSGIVNQKKLDAIALLDVLKGSSLGRPETQFIFEYTTLWDELRRTAGKASLEGDAHAGISADAILDELRLASSDWRSEIRDATFRRLGVQEARRIWMTIDEDRVVEEAARFCAMRGLLDDNRLDLWLMENHLTPASFHALISKELLFAQLQDELAPDVHTELLDLARVSGRYPVFAARARRKQSTLAVIDAYSPSQKDYEDAVAWLARKQSCHGNAEQLANMWGFASTLDMMRAALAEKLFTELEDD